MPKLIPILTQVGGADAIRGYLFYCPACKQLHAFYVAGPPPLWNFNGSLESPSFSPSLRVTDEHRCCHLSVSQGLIQYCNDCTHEFSNKTIPMVDWDLENWRPAMSEETIQQPPAPAAAAPEQAPAASAPSPAPSPRRWWTAASAPSPAPAAPQQASAAPAPPAAPKPTHQPECGEVGITGEHGDLGSNAAD